MPFRCSLGDTRWILPMLALAMAGCRETEPGPAHARDLGSKGAPLLPTSAVWHDVRLADGQADWQPFRKPGEHRVEEAATRPSTPPPDAPSAETTAQVSPVEQELRDLLADYNDAVAEDAPREELLDFFVEGQRDRLDQVLDSVAGVAGKVDELRKAMADAGWNVDVVLASLPSGTRLRLDVGDIDVTDEAHAAGKLASAGDLLQSADVEQGVRFVLVDEYWYIDLPAVDRLASRIPAFQGYLAQLDTLTQGVRSGTVSAEALAQQLSGVAQSMGLAPPPADGSVAPIPEPSADDD